jgi:hypothetical protein
MIELIIKQKWSSKLSSYKNKHWNSEDRINKKFGEELIPYIPFTVIWISDRTSREKTLVNMINEVNKTIWEAAVLVLLMGINYVVHCWDGIRGHNIHIKFHEDLFGHSGNITVITLTIREAAVLVLLMGRIYDVGLKMTSNGMIHTYISSFTTPGQKFK